MSDEITVGTEIIVKARGRSVRGTVITAHNYGRDGQDDWYIEFEDENGWACYVKQVIDKATIEIVYPESFKVWVRENNSDSWATNGIEHENWKDGSRAARDLFSRWFGIDAWAVCPVVFEPEGYPNTELVLANAVDSSLEI